MFRYVRPRDLDEAVAALAAGGDSASLLAGGTDLLVSMRQGLVAPAVVIGIRGLPELNGIGPHGEDPLRIGAGIALTDLAEHPIIVARYPALAQAARSVGSRHVRNMATLGGNLRLPTRCWYTNQSENWRASRIPCWKTDGGLCHVIKTSTTCRAINSSDTAPALLALDARLEAVSVRGRREVALADFYNDDGVNHTTLASDEIITAVLLPAARVRTLFTKATARTGLDYGYGTLAAAVTGSNRAIRSARIVAGSVGSWPVLLAHAGAIIVERGLNESAIADAAAAAREDLGEVANLFSPPGYKKRLVRGLVLQVLEQLRRQKLPVD
ncbi:MAG: FAD binding domain-containing protein [Gammaproteobacteria bacterium]|nr:FAD binding domain-containing protein [Gammaproteobacteria bacterium]